MPADLPNSLHIERIFFTDFRNYDKFSLSCPENLTVFIGRNAIGKTNILEGIQLLTSGNSFRHPQITQLIRQDCPSARISVDISDGNRQITTALSLEPGKKRFTVNGKAKGIADVRGMLPAVIFTPDDLELAKKSSGVKRDMLDDLGVQLSRNYYIVRRDYEKTLRYKNRLLKEEASRALVESINETLITCGSQLFCYRFSLFNRLIPLVKRNYSDLAGTDEEFTADYQLSWNYLAGKYGEGEFLLDSGENGSISRDQVRGFLSESLYRYYDRERQRGASLVGPHNDKIAFAIGGRDASSFASQGQQRSVVLAWKLAEVELTRQMLEVSPVLLLDDVMSELDSVRRDMLVRFVSEDIQTFITATDLGGFNQELLDRSRVVDLAK